MGYNVFSHQNQPKDAFYKEKTTEKLINQKNNIIMEVIIRMAV